MIGRHERHASHGFAWKRWRSARAQVALFVLLGVSVLLAGCAEIAENGGTTTNVGQQAGDTTTLTRLGASTTLPDSALADDPLTSPAIAVAEAVGPSVVNVAVEGSVPGFAGQEIYSSEGSGVILTADGMIITNNHVISRESGGQEYVADKVTVTMATGEVLAARIVGRDPLTDLAVLEVQASDLPAATFIESFDEVLIGQYAIAIGSPLGFENSVTLGIISGVHRGLDVQPGISQFSLVDLIQTDAAISPGNSGGALVDARGRVIGINVAYLPPSQTGAQNVGFAIPADLAIDVARQIMATGRAVHAYLGISNVSVTEALRERFNLTRSKGVLVAGTEPGAPADLAGLQQGDIIIEFNGQVINSDSDLYSILRRMKPGDTVSLDVDREGAELTFEVTLGERPE